MRYSGIFLGLSLVCGGLQSAAAAVVDDHLIVPGVRIGPISIGMSEGALYNALGEPDSTDAVHFQSSVQYKYSHRWVVVGARDRRVSQVGSDDSIDATAEGLRIGTSGISLSAKYGIRTGCVDVAGGRELGCQYHTANGLGLGISVDGSVNAVNVFRPGSRHF